MQSTSPALLEVFRNTYFKTAQQKQSKFQKAGVLEYDSANGAIHNIARIKPFELAAINAKNTVSNEGTKTAWTTDNRSWYTTYYYAELLMDKEIDVQKAIADPTSSLMMNAVAAGNRQIDRACAVAAIADVTTGAPEQAKQQVAFAADGGIEIDATGGITEQLLRSIAQNFQNSGLVDDEEWQNAAVFITGSEEKALLGLDKLVNRLYTTYTDENKARCQRIFDTYKVFVVPGSDAAHAVANPILNENEQARKCLVVAPGALHAKIDIKSVEHFPTMETYLNSQMLRFKIEVGACRTEGARVQVLKTTIEQ